MPRRLLTKHEERYAVLVAALSVDDKRTMTDCFKEAYPAALGWADKAARDEASRIAAKPEVAQRIQQLRDAAAHAASLRTGVKLDRVLLENARIALFDPRLIFQPDGKLIPVHQMSVDAAAAIASIKLDRDGRAREVRLVDKGAAIEKLMRHLGGYEKDNRQRTDPVRALLDALNGNVVRPLPEAADPPEDDDGSAPN